MVFARNRSAAWPKCCTYEQKRKPDPGVALIYAVSVSVDLQTLDAGVPYRLMAPAQLMPGAQRTIPGGVLVFQSAVLSDIPGEASLYRFAVQFGARHAAATVGN